MPKRSYTTAKRSYVPRRRGASVKKPYGGSRYGNDAFVKVESIEPLATPANATVDVFSVMRVTPPVAADGNQFLKNQEEFKSFSFLYARYEVVGMKAEVTLNPRVTFASANLAGGFAPRMPAAAIFPSEENNVAYPMQKQCNVQGEVTSLYYAYSKDLKNSGTRHAIATTSAFDLQDQGVMQFRGVLGQASASTVVGSVKYTWYVRFHGRTIPVQPVLKKKEPLLGEAPSEMSYAELQAQVQSMMSK